MLLVQIMYATSSSLGQRLARSELLGDLAALGDVCLDVLLDALGDVLGSVVLGIAVYKVAVGAHQVEEDGVVDQIILALRQLGGLGEVDAVRLGHPGDLVHGSSESNQILVEVCGKKGGGRMS